MTLSPLSLLVLKIGMLLNGRLDLDTGAQALNVPPGTLRPVLDELLAAGLLSLSPQRPGLYEITAAGASAPVTQSTWREVRCEFTDAAIALNEGLPLEACSILISFINTLLDRSQSSGAVACFGLLLQVLGQWHPAAPGADDMRTFVKLVLSACDISMYLSKRHGEVRALAQTARSMAQQLGERRMTVLFHLLESSLENMAAECGAQRMFELHAQCEAGLRELDRAGIHSQAGYFIGMFNFWHGHFREALTAFEDAQRQPQLWECRFQTEMFSLYTSSSAVYLGRFHQSVGILEAAKRAAALSQDNFKTLWWEAQLAMVLLYMKRFDEALELIDHVLATVNPETETKIAHWGMRGLAFYHYMQGNIQASHTVMKNAMWTASRYGFKRPIYSYPWMFDMLLAYEQTGLPAIPGMDLDDELQRALDGYNDHLRAAALRAKAVRSLFHGKTRDAAERLLNESLREFERIGNPTETALTRRLQAQIRLLRPGEAFILDDVRRLADAAPPEETTAPGSGDILFNCRLALNSIKMMGDFSQYLNQMTYIASCELGAERAALLEADNRGVLVCRAACNISSVELNTGSVLSRAARIHTAQRGTPLLLGDDDRTSLSLPLETSRRHWLLWLESKYAVSSLRDISKENQRLLAALFTRELDAAEHDTPSQAAGLPPDEQERAQTQPYHDTPEILLHGSSIMRRILSQTRQIASTDASVLVLGETGVGKELLARYIHECSGRTGPFVPVHPASIPDSLFESEFFGHERGSFTGAVKQKIGLVEMAHQGTLFIDEVGDIPAAMQVKLLRVCQDHRFMRVGGGTELHSDFRLVSATNKDLWQEVQEGHFREDLYYRLSVVPLTLPPLRERKEDIDVLVRLFLDRYAKRYHRDIRKPDAEELAPLMRYDWPGNVRELKSVVERTVILYQNGPLHFALSTRESPKAPGALAEAPAFDTADMFKTLPTVEELQRRYIEHVLHLTNGRITGSRGALTILGMKRSTLYARMKQYGIQW